MLLDSQNSFTDVDQIIQHLRVKVCVCACACVRVRACVRACVCVCVRACVRACVRVKLYSTTCLIVPFLPQRAMI